MFEPDDKLIDKMKMFGVNEDAATLYLFLLGKKSKSVLSISNGVGMSRTKVYRAVDELEDKGLVSCVWILISQSG